jgi:hypothetical protein
MFYLVPEGGRELAKTHNLSGIPFGPQLEPPSKNLFRANIALKPTFLDVGNQSSISSCESRQLLYQLRRHNQMCTFNLLRFVDVTCSLGRHKSAIFVFSLS